MSALVSGTNFLRTQNVRYHSGSRVFGMGYKTLSKRNVPFWSKLPSLRSLLISGGRFKAPSGADNKTGTKPLCGNVFDQNQVGSCTAESTCKASRITLQGKGLMPAGVEDFSQRIMYGQTRQIERAATQDPNLPEYALTDSGCEPADCITSINSLGIAPMEAPVGGYYNDVWSANVNQEIILKDEEKTWLEPGAHLVDVSPGNSSLVQEWQAAVNANLGSTLALFVDTQNFMAYDGSTPIQKIDLNDPQGGGHQITGPVGWYTSSSLGLVWIFLNSWGSWGQAGFGEITHNCLMTSIDASIVFDTTLEAA